LDNFSDEEFDAEAVLALRVKAEVERTLNRLIGGADLREI